MFVSFLEQDAGSAAVGFPCVFTETGTMLRRHRFFEAVETVAPLVSAVSIQLNAAFGFRTDLSATLGCLTGCGLPQPRFQTRFSGRKAQSGRCRWLNMLLASTLLGFIPGLSNFSAVLLFLL